MADLHAAPAPPRNATVVVEARLFRRAVEGAALAVAKRDKNHLRPVLEGVRIEVDGTRLSICATDSYRLHHSTLPAPMLDGENVSASYIPKELVAFSKALSGAVQITVGEKELTAIGTDAWAHASEGSDGDYPNWRALLPNTADYSEWTFDARELSAICTTVEKMSRIEKAGSQPVVITSNGHITVSYGDAFLDVQSAKWAVSARAVRQPDDLLRIGFTPRYLRDAIKAVGTKQVTLLVKDGLKPAVLRGGDEASVVETLLMPVRLSWRNEV